MVIKCDLNKRPHLRQFVEDAWSRGHNQGHAQKLSLSFEHGCRLYAHLGSNLAPATKLRTLLICRVFDLVIRVGRDPSGSRRILSNL